jgi:hypothetical protein
MPMLINKLRICAMALCLIAFSSHSTSALAKDDLEAIGAVSIYFKNFNGKRLHLGKVTPLLSGPLAPDVSVKVLVQPGPVMDSRINLGVKIETPAKRVCIGALGFEAVSVFRYIYRTQGNRYMSMDELSCVTIDKDLPLTHTFDVNRIDIPVGVKGGVLNIEPNLPTSQAQTKDGFVLLNVVTDGVLSVFRIDSPYFTKEALDKDPLSVK